jgi:hypothetical protein
VGVAFASADDFRGLKPAFEDVPAPELGAGKTVRVRVMSALAKDRWEASNFVVEADKVRANFEWSRARLLVASCCGEDFAPLFTLEDVTLLNDTRSDLVDRLYEAAERLNGINEGIELAKKVFAAVRSGGSRSTSQSGSGTRRRT